jgi:dipeptidyl aminopeptidase/acylaminoacyl peptidase
MIAPLRRGAALAWLGLACALTGAQAAAPLTAERMWELSRLGDPAIAPDGRLAVVPVTRYDLSTDQPRTALWLVPVTGGAPRQLTTGSASAAEPAFSPDGRAIAFVSKRGDDEEPQIYVIELAGGEARRVTQIPTGASQPKWFADSRRIAFMSRVWPDLVRWEDQRRRLAERREAAPSGMIFDRAPVSHWDHFLDERVPQLFSVALAGGDVIAITRGSGYSPTRRDFSASSWALSPDGLEVLFEADTDPSGTSPNLDVIALPACGCKPARNLTAGNPANDSRPAYSPDGRWISYAQQHIAGFDADQRRLVLIDRRSAQRRTLAAGWDRSAEGIVWLADSSALLGSISDAGTRRVHRFDLRDGRAAPLTSTSSFSALAAGRGAVIALRESFAEPPTLVRVDLRSGAATALTHFNDSALVDMTLGRTESVAYAGARGEPIQMWITYPPDFDPARKWPLLMVLHGGPHVAMTEGTQWRWNAQVFAAWGYVVTWHNFHGSDGFGQAFADSINPDRVTLPYEDTIRAAQWLAAQPYIDPSRMIAGGGSYGGELAALLLGREHPFKALIAHAAVYDEYAQYAADYGATKPRFGGFWERAQEFARNSPHAAAANFSTPTLVIHGGLDRRVPSAEGIELFNTLQMRGVPSRLLFFPDEGHWIQKPRNSLLWYRTVQGWLAQWAPPGAR